MLWGRQSEVIRAISSDHLVIERSACCTESSVTPNALVRCTEHV